MDNLSDVERYAIHLVGSGAESYAEDDVDEEDELPTSDDHYEAVKLAVRMARMIRDNPEEFLAWYNDDGVD